MATLYSKCEMAAKSTFHVWQIREPGMTTCMMCGRRLTRMDSDNDGPTERLFRLLGALGRLHVDAETDLRAAAMVWRATSRRVTLLFCPYTGTDFRGLARRRREAVDKASWARANLRRLADEAVGLKKGDSDA